MLLLRLEIIQLIKKCFVVIIIKETNQLKISLGAYMRIIQVITVISNNSHNSHNKVLVFLAITITKTTKITKVKAYLEVWIREKEVEEAFFHDDLDGILYICIFYLNCMKYLFVN